MKKNILGRKNLIISAYSDSANINDIFAFEFSSNSSFVECKRSVTDITSQLKLSVLCASMEIEKEPIFVDLERMLD